MRTLRTVKIDLKEIIARAGGGPGRLYWHQEYGSFVFQSEYAGATMVKVDPPSMQGLETKVSIEGSFWVFKGGSQKCERCLGTGEALPSEPIGYCQVCGGSGELR